MVADKKLTSITKKVYFHGMLLRLTKCFIKGGDYCVRPLDRKSYVRSIASSNPEIISSLVKIINNKKYGLESCLRLLTKY